MPRTNIPVTTPTRNGVLVPAPVTGDPVNNHEAVNDGHTVFLVKNTGSTVSRTVTFHLARTVDGFSVTPRTKSIDFGTEQVFGPFPSVDYGDTIQIDVDNAELTIRALRV